MNCNDQLPNSYQAEEDEDNDQTHEEQQDDILQSLYVNHGERSISPGVDHPSVVDPAVDSSATHMCVTFHPDIGKSMLVDQGRTSIGIGQASPNITINFNFGGALQIPPLQPILRSLGIPCPDNASDAYTAVPPAIPGTSGTGRQFVGAGSNGDPLTAGQRVDRTEGKRAAAPYSQMQHFPLCHNVLVSSDSDVVDMDDNTEDRGPFNFRVSAGDFAKVDSVPTSGKVGSPKPSALLCAVCVDRVPYSRLACGHVFCEDCLLYMLSTETDLLCPNCRSKFSEWQKIYF